MSLRPPADIFILDWKRYKWKQKVMITRLLTAHYLRIQRLGSPTVKQNLCDCKYQPKRKQRFDETPLTAGMVPAYFALCPAGGEIRSPVASCEEATIGLCCCLWVVVVLLVFTFMHGLTWDFSAGEFSHWGLRRFLLFFHRSDSLCEPRPECDVQVFNCLGDKGPTTASLAFSLSMKMQLLLRELALKLCQNDSLAPPMAFSAQISFFFFFHFNF